jgi:fatty acyl-CoA reductase
MDGDVSQNNLGLMDSEIQYLIDNCQIVIHSAATVRFDSPLNQAFRINVGGTTTILKIATEMKKLEVHYFLR